jgi:tetratricopeptide (TPR) repeat protein
MTTTRLTSVRDSVPAAADGRSAGNAREGWHRWLWLALTVLALLAYLPALSGSFIWDDDSYIVQNQTLRSLRGLMQIWFEPTSIPQYYPLVHTTFWSEYHLWGLHPTGYHIVNVLLHAFAAFLLGCTLERLKLRGAWWAAAIFALHPVEVESVAWVTERKNVLSAVLYFAAALAYMRFEPPEPGPAPAQRRWGWYAAALGLFVAALLSKTVTCSLPAALLLVMWWKRGRLDRDAVLPLAPFFVVGAGLGFLTAWLEKHHVGAQGPAWSLSFVQRCLIASRAFWFYAGKLLWPARLTFTYPRWQIDPAQWWQWLFPIAAAGLVAALWVKRRKLGLGPFVAVLFFAGTLGPALGFINVYPMRYSFVADHFQYLASIGLIALCAEAFVRMRRFIPGTAGVGVIVLLGALTWRQAGIYRNLETLWRDSLAKNPRSWLAHNNLGLELENQGRLDEAFIQYETALPLSPDFPETYNNIGNALIRKGLISDAMDYYRKAIQLNPRYVAALNSLGVAYGMEADYTNAIACLRAALRLQPTYARAHGNLGNVLRAQHDLDGATREYTQAILLDPGNASLYRNLGLVLEDRKLFGLVVPNYEEALRLEPTSTDVHYRLAGVFARLGRRDEAILELKAALQLDPNYSEATAQLRALQAGRKWID